MNKLTELGRRFGNNILEQLETYLYNLNFKKWGAIVIGANLTWYVSLNINSEDYNQQLYWSPSRFVSRMAGELAVKEIPVQYRERIFKTFMSQYNVIHEDMVEPDLNKYENFMQFFTRQVKPRDFSKEQKDLIVPADSKILSYTEVQDDSVFLIKDINYSLGHLLTGNKGLIMKGSMLHDLKVDPQNKLYSVIFYLAPGDYHRFHAPSKMLIRARHHIFGLLKPVKISYISKYKGVYEGNERVTLYGEYNQGFMSMVVVGALNVGSIALNFDDITTNVKLSERPTTVGSIKSYEADLKHRAIGGIGVERGDEMGMFKLGSTVVLIFEAKDVEWLVKPDEKVRWGQTFARVL